MSRVKWVFVFAPVGAGLRACLAALFALMLTGSFIALTPPAGARPAGAGNARAVRPFGASPTPTQACGPAWRLVDSPNSGSSNNDLNSIAALSSADIWAVGNVESQTLTMHWDGSQWSIVPSPSAGTLYGVAAVSSTNVWAAGYTGDFPG